MKNKLGTHKILRTEVMFVLLCILLEIGAPISGFCICKETGKNIENTIYDSQNYRESTFEKTAFSNISYKTDVSSEIKNDYDSPNDTHYLGKRVLRRSISSNRFNNNSYSGEPILIAGRIPPNQGLSTIGVLSKNNDVPNSTLCNLRTVILLN